MSIDEPGLSSHLKRNISTKKGFLLLLGLVAIVAIALLPVTRFAASATGTATSHKIHFFHSRGHAQPSKPASASASTTLTYNGGPVMTGTTNVYAIFWEPTGNVSANYNSLIERYFSDVGGSPLYKVSNQYTQTDGQSPINAVLKGFWVDNGAYPRQSPLLDSDITTEVTHAQSSNGWTSGIDNVFFVFIEKNVGLCNDTKTQCTPDVTPTNGFCAYHGAFGTNNSTIYAAMPYAASPNFNFGCTTGALAGLTGSSPNNNDADQTINAASHEQMEAATDPQLNAWYDTANGYEIGDLCAYTFGPGNLQGADVLWNKNPYIVQQEWSNAISGCTLTTNATINSGNTYYQIVNRNSGLAMGISGGSTSNGAQVVQWPYQGALNQQWSLVPDGNSIQLKNHNSGLVLGVSSGSTSPLANLVQWTNQNAPNQQWFLVPDGGYDVIGNFNSSLVAEVSGGSTSAGAHVIQNYFYNGLSQQQWELVPLSPFEIVNRNSNQVAAISGGSTSAGAHVIQWPYQGALNQQWTLVSDGAYYQIVDVNSKLVMAISGGSTSAGAQVIQWTNQNALNQQWSLVPDGANFQLKNRGSGLVLGVSGGSTSQGANLVQWTNLNALNQQWSLIPTVA